MEEFTAWMEKHFMPIAAKIGSQKHPVATRDGFIGIMPVTMTGAAAILLNVLFHDLSNSYLSDWYIAETSQWLIGINGNTWWGTLAILTIAFAFSLGYHLAKAYDVNLLAGGPVALASFVTILAQSAIFNYQLPDVAVDALNTLKNAGLDVTSNDTKDAILLYNATGWGFLSYVWTNSGGLSSVLTVGLISVTTYAKLMTKKVTIKLPEQASLAVSKAFAATIPGTIAIYTVGTTQFLCIEFLGNGLPELINQYLQIPFQNLLQDLDAIIVLVFAVQVFWFFGLHGSNVLAPTLDGRYISLPNDNTNICNTAMAAGKSLNDVVDQMFVWTCGSSDALVWMGGSGCTITLLIAIMTLSKRDDARTVAKLSLPMGCFSINEPVIFDLPIVLNPIYFIPWLITLVILATIAYPATTSGPIPSVLVTVLWVIPLVIYIILATGDSPMARVTAAINLVVAVFCWIPFVAVANRMNSVEE